MRSDHPLLFLTLVFRIVSCQLFPEAQGPVNNRIFRRITVPRGSSLSLTAQVSRPKILPTLVPNEDAIILDAVVELPMWLDLDRFTDAVYGVVDEEVRTGPAHGRTNSDDLNSFRGKERCIFYRHLESFVSTLLLLPLRTTHGCLLRAICEVNEISTFYFPEHSPSLGFELMKLLLSPSLGKDDCHNEFKVAEVTGRSGLCYKYNSRCPLNISALLYSYLLPVYNSK